MNHPTLNYEMNGLNKVVTAKELAINFYGEGITNSFYRMMSVSVCMENMYKLVTLYSITKLTFHCCVLT
jgi:hypothetical protein